MLKPDPAAAPGFTQPPPFSKVAAMIGVTPIAAASLRHRAFHLAVADSGHLVAFSKKGRGTFIGPDRKPIKTVDLACHTTGVAISPSGDLIVVLKEDALCLLRTPTLTEIRRLSEPVESCLFFPTQSMLWTATRRSSSEASIEVRDLNDVAIIARADMDDPFEESALMLFPHPHGNRVALWVAGGQDGQCLYWADYLQSSLNADRFASGTDMTPPAFDRDGKRFLFVSGSNLHLYQYPAGPELGRMTWPFDDDPAGETVAFAGHDHAVIHSGNGRLFLIDLRKMTIAEEILMQGHEPRPARQLYPNLSRDFDLCSDLSTFIALPNGEFLSTHRKRPADSMEDWPDELLWWIIPHSSAVA